MPASTIAPSDFTLLCDVITYVARTSGFQREDAEDFSQHCHLRLLERNYAPLALFSGQSTLRTFLTVVVKRLLMDWRDSRQGKWRPSTAAKRLGSEAVDIDRLISRDGHTEDEAIAIVAGRQTALSVQALRAMARQLPRRTRFQTVAPEDIEMLSVGVFDDPVERAELRAAKGRALRALREACKRLPEPDRRLLHLRFGKKLSIPAIATLLDTPSKPLYRRIDAILSSLRRPLVHTSLGKTTGVNGADDSAALLH